jgi:hypothetical protein
MASACAQNGVAPIVIDYPADGSVFPPDMAAPTFLWRDPAPGAVSWQIDVSFADGSAAIHAAAKGERMRIGEIDPRCVAPTNQPPRLTPQQAAARTWIPGSRHRYHRRLHRRECPPAGIARTHAARYFGGPGRRAHLLPRRAADAVENGTGRHQTS